MKVSMTCISQSSDFVLYLEDYVMYVHHTLGVLWKYESVWPDVWPQSKCRSLWPIFHGPMIWPHILKVIWCMNIFIWDYESLWPDVWAQINVGHCDLYFMVHWFGLISWRLFDVWTSLFGIMNHYDLTFDLKINVGHCDLYFMVQWFCVTSWGLFDVWTSYFGIMGQYGLMFDLKINVGHCDLYLVVQWFFLISPTLFDAWVSYFQIMRQCDPNFDLKVNISQHDLYLYPGIYAEGYIVFVFPYVRSFIISSHSWNYAKVLC